MRLSHVIVGWHAAHEPAWRIPTPPVWLGDRALGGAGGLRGGARQDGGAWPRALPPPRLLALLVWHPFPPEIHAGRVGDERHRRGPGRQHPGGLPRWREHAGGWRRHPRFRPPDARRSSTPAKTWWRPTCGSAACAASISWRSRTRMTTTSAACPRWWPISIRASCGPAPLPTAPRGANCATRRCATA